MRIALVLAALLLAGCAASGPKATTTTPGGSHLPHAETESDGFRLVGDASAASIAPPGGVTFSFVATNEGDDATALRDPCGDGNPSVRVESPQGEVVTTQPPHVRCMVAATFGPFARGEAAFANFTWNGTVYDAQGEPRPATTGTYSVIGSFTAERNGTRVDVEARLLVNVFAQPPAGTY